MTDTDGLTVYIPRSVAQEAIEKGVASGTGVVRVSADGSTATVEDPKTGTFDDPLPFDPNRVPVDTEGMITGAQHPGYDPRYMINYTGFGLGWYLQRKNDGTPYFCNAHWTEYQACPYLPPPNPETLNYVIVDLPS